VPQTRTQWPPPGHHLDSIWTHNPICSTPPSEPLAHRLACLSLNLSDRAAADELGGLGAASCWPFGRSFHGAAWASLPVGGGGQLADREPRGERALVCRLLCALLCARCLHCRVSIAHCRVQTVHSEKCAMCIGPPHTVCTGRKARNPQPPMSSPSGHFRRISRQINCSSLEELGWRRRRASVRRNAAGREALGDKQARLRATVFERERKV